MFNHARVTGAKTKLMKKRPEISKFLYLTIRLQPRDIYEVIVDEGEVRINYHLIEIESE